ncbi:MAG: hypothetical protein ACFFB3_18210 [Candidatus Hodarchaeota archaeon]
MNSFALKGAILCLRFSNNFHQTGFPGLSDWTGMEDASYEFMVTATSQTDPTAYDNDAAERVIEDTKESQAMYVNLELEQLIDHIRATSLDKNAKKSLLAKLNNVNKKKEQALNYILQGRAKLANTMLKACESIMKAFIHEVKAQSGKNIPGAHSAQGSTMLG